MKLFTKLYLSGAFIIVKFFNCRFQEKNIKSKKTILFSLQRGEDGKSLLVDASAHRRVN